MNTTDPAVEEKKRKAREAFNRLDGLLDNENFQWFLREVLEKKRDEQRDAALNPVASLIERDHACHKHEALRDACAAATDLRRMHAQQAGITLE